MERHNITPGFVEDALDCVRQRGMDTASLMAAIGLPETVTEPVTNVEYGHLWWLIAETIEDEFFGLAARPMRPGSFNLLCHAVLHAGTLERALRRALQFLNVVLDDPRGELRIRDGMAHVVLRDAGPPRPAFAYRAYWLILMGIACWLVGGAFRCAHSILPVPRQCTGRIIANSSALRFILTNRRRSWFCLVLSDAAHHSLRCGAGKFSA